MRDKRNTQQGSFVVDIPLLLPFFALLGVYVKVRWIYRITMCKVVGNILLSFICAAFCATVLGLYFDLFSFGFISSMSGNDFMWNWPVEPWFGWEIVGDNSIPTYENFWGFWNLFGLFLIGVVYLLEFYLCVQLGYLLFGRSPKQKGMISLLFPRKKSDPFN